MLGPDTDVFPLAVQMLHECFGGLGDIGPEASQCALDHRIPLPLKLLAECLVPQPL
jgi:hypothetical protein